MAVWMSISFAVDDADEFVVDPNMDRLFGNFGYALWFAGTTIALLVVLCAALVGLRGELIPKWLAWVSVLVAITMLASFAFIPFLIWLGWVLVVSLMWLFWKPARRCRTGGADGLGLVSSGCSRWSGRRL